MPSAFQRKARTLPTATASASSSQSSDPTSAATTSAPAHRIPTHPTLRPSPFPQQQPLPLFSLGLSAINDVLTGVGLPSGCLSIFQPLQSGPGEDDHDHERTRLEAGAAYPDLVLKYAAAQGIAHGHRVLVIGEGAQSWCRSLMGWAGEHEQRETASGSAPTPGEHDQEEQDNQDDSTSLTSKNNLKSAFRYDKLQKIQARQGLDDPRATSSRGDSDSPSHFVHPFDLTMRMSDATLDLAIKEKRLCITDVSDFDSDSNSYEAVWSAIQDFVGSPRSDAFETEGHQTPLRIIVPSLGSPMYGVGSSTSHSIESYRFLMRVRRLVRDLSWPSVDPASSQSAMQSVPSIALCTLSPSLLLSTPSISHRLCHLSDATLAFSAFASDARLRAMFNLPDGLAESSSSSSSKGSSSSSSSSTSNTFTGSLKILKTPTVGSLRPSSIRASTLRGMTSNALDTSSSGTTENSLGFKVRRKGFKVEIMGRDLVAGGDGGEQDKTKRPERRPPPKSDASAEENKQQQQQAKANPSESQPQPAALPPPSTGKSAATTSTSSPQPPLKGIAALRARGLQASSANSRSSSSGGTGNNTIQVEKEGGAPPDINDDADSSTQKRLQGLRLAAKQDW